MGATRADCRQSPWKPSSTGSPSGRIDAVFAEPDGGVIIVDWKTDDPTRARGRALGAQLACYRTAYARLVGLDESQVAAAFSSPRPTTVFPRRLPQSWARYWISSQSERWAASAPSRGSVPA